MQLKQCLKEKLLLLNAYITNEERPQVSDVRFHFKKLKNIIKKKSKVNTRKARCIQRGKIYIPPETVPEETQASELRDQDFQRTLLKMLKELTENTDKELKDIVKMIYEHNQNMNKEKKIFLRYQTKNSRDGKCNN